MKIKLEETKKEFMPFTLKIHFETYSDVITFKDMLCCVDQSSVSTSGGSLAEDILTFIENK